MSGRYAGPVIDAHHHLWDLSMGRHPWLTAVREPGEEMVMGSIDAIRKDYLPADYLRDTVGEGVVATVHVEAGWDAAHVAEETRWLHGLERPAGIARRLVARVALGDADAGRRIAEEVASPDVVGIRDIVGWHPDPAKSFVPRSDLMDDPAWRAGLAEVGRHGLVFDLLLYPWQAADALRLAADFPGITFAINHCGSPADRSAEGMATWRRAIADLARADNVTIKISDPVAYDPDWTLESLRPVVSHCIECFGPGRAMFASDFPVTGLHASFAAIYDAFRTLAAPLSPGEQHDLFFATANRVYRVGLEAG